MPARAISRRRERRFLALIEGGATISEASRAAQVSRTTIYRRAEADPAFAELLNAAREHRAPDPLPIEPFDWREVATQLETDHPEHWALPGGEPFAEFDFDPP
jgi:hypothetical protein